jgi:hypothetical protein
MSINTCQTQTGKKKQVSSKPSYPLARLQDVTSQPRSQSSSEANGFGISQPIKQEPLKRYIEKLLRQNTHALIFTALTLLGRNEGSCRLRTTLTFDVSGFVVVLIAASLNSRLSLLLYGISCSSSIHIFPALTCKIPHLIFP